MFDKDREMTVFHRLFYFVCQMINGKVHCALDKMES